MKKVALSRRWSWNMVGGSVLLGTGLFLSWVLFVAALTADDVVGTNGALSLLVPQQAGEEIVEVPAVQAPVYANWLNGDIVGTAEAAKPHPIGVMIENLPVVRPQSGLQQAKIVYETLAEGGATRFLVLFDGSESMPKIGPVRSVRHYYLEWVSEYDSAIMHAGGSPQGLQYISGFAMKDLECLGRAARYCFRDRGISAPHNLFTKSELLAFAMRDNAWTPTDFAPWPYKDQKSLEERPTEARAPNVHFSSFSFDAQYTYNRADNCYLRTNGGQPHRDALSGEQICVKNVIVQFVPEESYLGEKGRIGLNVTGEGRVLIFRDGDTIENAKWKKESRVSRTVFLNEDGQDIDLVRGSTWVHIIPGGRSVEY